MRFFEAFQQTLLRFKLRAADIAQQSGITPTKLSQFRNGRNIRIYNMERLLATLPKEARKYLLSLVMKDPTADLTPLSNAPLEDLENER